MAALDPSRLIREVLSLIHRAMGTCSYPKDERPSAPEFLDILGEYLHHLYRYGRRLPLDLSLVQAKARALELLEGHYQGSMASGYAGALLDATSPHGSGLAAVLEELAAIVAGEELSQQVRAIVAKLVDPADWGVQRRLTAAILAHLGDDLPAHLRERPVESLVPAYFDLVALLVAAHGSSQPWNRMRVANGGLSRSASDAAQGSICVPR